MRFEELNWFDVDNYLQNDDRLMLILGSCEQHGYLSLLTDIKIPLAIADAASQQSGVLIAPSLNFGCSPYFLAYPGTLSLRVSTLLDVVEDIIRSVYRLGFHKILVLNGHGGNDPARARLYELLNELSGLHIRWYAWWQSHSIEQVAHRHGLKPAHANWLEAFPFTRVSAIPNEEKIPPSVTGLIGAKEARETYGDGVFGGVYQVDRNIMDELFKAALADVMYLLDFT